MKKSNYYAPYYKKGKLDKCTFSPKVLREKAGVYFIRKKGSNEIVYVGSSTSNLYRTLYRHFQVWTDKSREKNFDRKTYPKYGYEVRFILCTPAQALKIERYYIVKLKPKDNPLKYKEYMNTTYNNAADQNLIAKSAAAPWVTKSCILDGECPF